MLCKQPDTPPSCRASPHDLKSHENLSKWRLEWEEIAKKHGLDTSQWEDVVTSIPSLNGEVFPPGSNEASFIHKVVKEICRLVPLSPHYDVHGVNGGSRLSQVVMSKFQVAQSACRSISCACTIALHGVGGAGKTTICKLMANAYSSHYPGKSLWLEFPSDGNKTIIAEECIKLLRQCTNASDEHVLSKTTSLDEIFPELDNRVSEHAIFLAIDNVWESSSEEARRLLEVEFNKESKILITSRSKMVLKELLKGCDEATCIHAVPSMMWEEALSTFERSFGHDLPYVPRQLLDGVLRLCLFGDSYHPLALNALGKKLRRMHGDCVDQNKVEANISHLSLSLVDAKIETLIRMNYDSIPSIRKDLFLDVVVVFLSDAFQNRSDARFLIEIEDMPIFRKKKNILDIPGGYDAIQKGLRILYADEKHSKYDIDVLMNQLAWDGLLDFEGVDDDKRIVVHDLYLELAKHEAIASPRFFLGSRQENSKDWSLVKRVVLHGCDVEENMVKVMEQNCPQLEVLIANEWYYNKYYYKGEIQLADQNMEALCILILVGMFLDISTSCILGKRLRSAGRHEVKRLRSAGRMQEDRSEGMHVPEYGWRGCVGRLAWLELNDCRWQHAVEAVYDMDRLEVLSLWSSEGPWKNVSNFGHGCGGLEEFRVSRCPLLKSITLSKAGQLQQFIVSECYALEEILVNLPIRNCPDLVKPIAECSGAHDGRLQIFQVSYCYSLEVIQGLHGFFNIELLSIQRCPLLKSISDQLVSVRTAAIHHCPLLKVIPRLNGVVDLQVMDAKSLEEIQAGLQDLMNLKTLEMVRCPLLKAIPRLSGAVQLTEIKIQECESLEEIPALTGIVNLKSLFISKCPRLKSIILLDLRGAIQLESIIFMFCESLEEISTCDGLNNLEKFSSLFCPRLKAIQDMSGAICEISSLRHAP